MDIDAVDIFYCEASPGDAPTLLLLQDFPTWSHLFRDLIPKLAEKYHVVAPAYPGFGYSAALSVDKFDYTFDNPTSVITKFVGRVGLKTTLATSWTTVRRSAFESPCQRRSEWSP